MGIISADQSAGLFKANTQLVTVSVTLNSHNYIKTLILYFVGSLVLGNRSDPLKPQDLWRCAGVSGTKTLAAEPLNPVSCKVGSQWIGLACAGHPTNVHLAWYWGIWRISQHLELFVMCGREHHAAERGHCC